MPLIQRPCQVCHPQRAPLPLVRCGLAAAVYSSQAGWGLAPNALPSGALLGLCLKALSLRSAGEHTVLGCSCVLLCVCVSAVRGGARDGARECV